MNVVYFLGAGASANAIPTINGIRDRIFDLKIFLSKYLEINLNESAYELLQPGIKDNQTILQFVIDDLDWLYNETKYHQTVDTFAKKLFLQESNELKRLKRCLITYFYFEQSLKFEPHQNKITGFNGYEFLYDLRYDSLFANIIHRKNNNLQLEDNINIITWNYDLQIEMALKNYFDSPINELKSNFRIHPNRESYDLETGEIITSNKFQVIKLNGNAFLDYGLQNGTKMTVYDKSWNELNAENIIGIYLNELKNEFGDELKLTNSASFKYFNFAWENNNNFGTCYLGKKNVIDSAKQIINNAEVLIVIGYSFPTFNFDVDKMLFENVRLKELIIQDENPNLIYQRMKPILKQIGQPNHGENPQLVYTPTSISQYFPIFKF